MRTTCALFSPIPCTVRRSCLAAAHPRISTLHHPRRPTATTAEIGPGTYPEQPRHLSPLAVRAASYSLPYFNKRLRRRCHDTDISHRHDAATSWVCRDRLYASSTLCLDLIPTLSPTPEARAGWRHRSEAPSPRPFFTCDFDLSRHVLVTALGCKLGRQIWDPSPLSVGQHGAYFSAKWYGETRPPVRFCRSTCKNRMCVRLRSTCRSRVCIPFE